MKRLYAKLNFDLNCLKSPWMMKIRYIYYAWAEESIKSSINKTEVSTGLSACGFNSLIFTHTRNDKLVARPEFAHICTPCTMLLPCLMKWRPTTSHWRRLAKLAKYFSSRRNSERECIGEILYSVLWSEKYRFQLADICWESAVLVTVSSLSLPPSPSWSVSLRLTPAADMLPCGLWME